MESKQAMNSDRLDALRRRIAADGLDGFVVPRGDEHLGEYTPPSAERLAWLTGFTGSAGLAIVMADRAAVFTDGRYTLQLADQTGDLWERLHIHDQPPEKWLAAHAAGKRIGYDPMLIAQDHLARLTDAGATMVPVAANPIDAIWTDRPAAPLAAAVPHPLDFAGRSSADKRADIAAVLRDAREDACVLVDPASICWLFNIRGGDVEFTPFVLAFALLNADATATLFIAPEKLDGATRAWLGNEVALRTRDDLAPALDAMAGKRVRVDPAGAPVWFAERLRAAGATVSAGPDPVALPKAQKNQTEQDGARAAHRRDAAAVCRFLHLIEQRGAALTESQAGDALLDLRAQSPEFRGESFPAITAAGDHGAIIHYRVTRATDRPIGENTVYLIDSGGQYPDGTTDITRTVWIGPAAPPDEARMRATRVLQGHIAIATLMFPKGVAGPHIDAFARRALWDAGLNYDHGTGHGVGSYLSVHEGPVGISAAARTVPIAAGMILSNEPGFYAPGEYGIRLENLLLVQPSPFETARPFLCFETLTLAPFDRRMIDPALLDPRERAWIDAYHARVLAEIGPDLPPDTREWLAAACAKLA